MSLASERIDVDDDDVRARALSPRHDMPPSIPSPHLDRTVEPHGSATVSLSSPTATVLVDHDESGRDDEPAAAAVASPRPSPSPSPDRLSVDRLDKDSVDSIFLALNKLPSGVGLLVSLAQPPPAETSFYSLLSQSRYFPRSLKVFVKSETELVVAMPGKAHEITRGAVGHALSVSAEQWNKEVKAAYPEDRDRTFYMEMTQSADRASRFRTLLQCLLVVDSALASRTAARDQSSGRRGHARDALSLRLDTARCLARHGSG